MPMSGRTASEATQQPGRGTLMFIEHHPESQPTATSRVVTSFARKWQSSQKRQHRRVSARQDAVYARSLVGWQSRAVRLPPQAQPSTHDESDSSSSTSQAITITSLQPTSGLRKDPFNSLPSEQSADMMSVADHFIHVWAPMAITHFDTLIGYVEKRLRVMRPLGFTNEVDSSNTYLSLYWPVALQDDMLFSATMACTRAAWCLSQGLLPETDRLHLQCRGLAMSKLRLRLSGVSPINVETFLFTVDYMLSVSYMWKDDEALDIHLAAFRNLAQRYLSTNDTSTVMSSVVAHRMKSWQALDNYRKQTDVFRQRLEAQSPDTGTQLTRIHDTLSLRQLDILASSPPALRQLTDLGLLSIELLDVVLQVQNLMDNVCDKSEGHAIASVTKQLKGALLAEHLTDIDMQIGYALVGLCHYLDPDFTSTTTFRSSGFQYPISNRPNSHQDLDTVAQTYINRKLTRCLHVSNIARSCALWSSTLLGSILLEVGLSIDISKPLSSGTLAEHGLKSKGHIILAATARSLTFESVAVLSEHWAAPLQTQWPPPEPDFDQLGQQFLGTRDLSEMWRRCWRDTIRRQQEWKEQGQLRVGNPVGPDDDEGKMASIETEYMVLMEARESFPVMSLSNLGTLRQARNETSDTHQ
ncbi:hypothetical protein PV08_05332 [Exophiala spinifera]|uniref:Transcription factor domain-containing protein n=1 Tax=Exophiala spinifera TaxID=91928 RepID=A0A0D1ZR48_9EURO|nr:uncharacterized protein PV08_05332 [Exophiala spinifera]KIW15287.1 hypothetical protein PV08_05332 [Exophiala spinifera]